MNDNQTSKITRDDFQIFDERAARGRAVAKALDNGTDIPFSSTVQTHKVSDFFDLLTPRRYQLLRLCKTGKRSIAELAVAAKRDPAATSRDIAKLEELGLVSLVVETHPRRQPKTVVRRAETNIGVEVAPLRRLDSLLSITTGLQAASFDRRRKRHGYATPCAVHGGTRETGGWVGNGRDQLFHTDHVGGSARRSHRTSDELDIIAVPASD